MNAKPPKKEQTALRLAGPALVAFAVFFSGLRAYLLFFSKNAGSSPAGFAAGFLEDAACAAGLALLTLLALAIGKRPYFAAVFPLQILVVLISYANFQYVNFYGDNIRLFDLEYVRNMGATWQESLRDVWTRPIEFLFLIIPLGALVGGGIILHRTRILKTAGKKIALPALSLAAAAFFACVGATALKKEAETSDFSRNNVLVGFIRDVPRLGAHFRMIREIRATTANQGKSGGKPGNGGKDPSPIDRFFPLAHDEVRYSGEYPYVKVPRSLASRIGIPVERGETAPANPEQGTRPTRNVVFIILESFRCREIGSFGAANGLTPNFDALASKGTLFTDFYGHCDMTAGAEFSALNSFYDVFKGVTVMRKHDRISLFSLPEILGLYGYSNLWINSWSADFDNSRNYFKHHGKFAIVDKDSFPPAAVMSGWSYSDEDTMRLAVKTMDESRKPFFAIVLTATNHVPYEVPEKKFELGLAADVFGKYLNTFHYTDYALGRFFDLVRDKAYFKNTVFFIFADTGNSRTPDGKPEEFERCENEFHIPLLIYDPADERGRVVDDLAGQIDLAPTVLDMLNIRVANPFIGRSLLRRQDSAFYLAYHGRDVPWVRYYDRDLFCSYNVNTRVLLGFGRKSGRPREIPADRADDVVARIRKTLDLGDWAIYNNRVWDPRINDFYKALLRAD